MQTLYVAKYTTVLYDSHPFEAVSRYRDPLLEMGKNHTDSRDFDQLLTTIFLSGMCFVMKIVNNSIRNH